MGWSVSFAFQAESEAKLKQALSQDFPSASSVQAEKKLIHDEHDDNMMIHCISWLYAELMCSILRLGIREIWECTFEKRFVAARVTGAALCSSRTRPTNCLLISGMLRSGCRSSLRRGRTTSERCVAKLLVGSALSLIEALFWLLPYVMFNLCSLFLCIRYLWVHSGWI